MDVTAMPQCLRMTPREEATTPFPIPEITPPVTRMYFMTLPVMLRLQSDTVPVVDLDSEIYQEHT